VSTQPASTRPTVAQIESELRALKDRALAASAINDRAFYASYLADDARAILPSGVLDKQGVLASMGGHRAPFAALRIEDTTVRVIGEDAGVVGYRAIYARAGQEYSVLVTTIYERRDGRWLGVVYQQTPQP